MNKIIFNILKKNNIDIAEDLYHYGWSIFVHYLFYLIITLSIAVYYHCVFQTIIFLFLYIPLRKYIGGFHFSNNIVCILISTTVSIIPVLLSRYYNINIWIIILTSIILIIETILIAPIDHPNKRLNDKQLKLYKKTSLFIEIIYIGVIGLAKIYTFSTILNFIFLLISFLYVALVSLILKEYFNIYINLLQYY
jgi:accessory gene regulator B